MILKALVGLLYCDIFPYKASEFYIHLKWTVGLGDRGVIQAELNWILIDIPVALEMVDMLDSAAKYCCVSTMSSIVISLLWPLMLITKNKNGIGK